MVPRPLLVCLVAWVMRIYLWFAVPLRKEKRRTMRWCQIAGSSSCRLTWRRLGFRVLQMKAFWVRQDSCRWV
jgi:hypothetical protein